MLTIYTTPTCPRCVLLKRWLESHNIQFQAKEIDGEAIADMRISGFFGMQAPVINTDYKEYHGPEEFFSGDAIDERRLRELI